jgi:ABC-2 type transport system permease protein
MIPALRKPADAAFFRHRRRPKYLALAALAIQQRFAYRSNVALDLVVNLAQLVAQMYLWRNVFANTPQVGSYDLARMQTYILVGYIVSSITFSFVVFMVIDLVRTGAIATVLTRPIDFMYAQLTEALGDAVVRGAVSLVIGVLLSMFFFHASLPASPAAGLLFALSLMLSFLVRVTFDFCISLFACYTLNGRGLHWIQWGVVGIFSGALIPLEFFPDWLKTIAALLPFQAIVSTPLNIYLGNVQGTAAWMAIGLQAFWVFVLWLLGRLLIRPSLQALEIQGG